MKEIKNKEIVIGLIVLIFLSIIAILLIVRREFPEEKNINEAAVTEEKIDYEDNIKEPEAAKQEAAIAESVQENLAIQDENADKEVKEEKEATEAAGTVEKNQMAELALYSEAELAAVGGYHPEPVLKEYTGEDMWQLEELYHYWIEYKLDAVNDLIHLPRVRTLTNELNGTNYFYYYGETDSKGNPDGSGLAVYADNTYYCGSWKSGKRSGQGMYWKIYPDKTGTIAGVMGVTEHMYNGSWLNDYPNGEGQEHFSYDYDVMKGDIVIANVIGNFADGYYDGELYIMTTNDREETTDWEAAASKGVFEYCNRSISASGKRTVWEKTKSKGSQDDFYWLDEPENVEFGVYGLKKAPQ